jgi:hypothetical protein
MQFNTETYLRLDGHAPVLTEECKVLQIVFLNTLVHIIYLHGPVDSHNISCTRV